MPARSQSLPDVGRLLGVRCMSCDSQRDPDVRTAGSYVRACATFENLRGDAAGERELVQSRAMRAVRSSSCMKTMDQLIASMNEPGQDGDTSPPGGSSFVGECLVDLATAMQKFAQMVIEHRIGHMATNAGRRILGRSRLFLSRTVVG
jgi:hypothetical protein